MERRRMTFLKVIGKGLSFFLLAGLVACNGETEEVEDEVVTDDAVVVETWDEDDYYHTFTAATYYKDWDVDGDKFLSEEEFTASFYETFDLNKDGRVSQGEWNRVIADYTNDVDAANWEAWDPDGDGFIEKVEFDAEFLQMGWYDTWDTDKDRRVTDREYAAGVFTIWDKNGDNHLDETEYTHHHTYYGN